MLFHYGLLIKPFFKNVTMKLEFQESYFIDVLNTTKTYHINSYVTLTIDQLCSDGMLHEFCSVIYKMGWDYRFFIFNFRP